MTFKARGIIFDTKFLKSDPENALIDYNTPITLMIAFKPHLEESTNKQKLYSPVSQKQGYLFRRFFTNNPIC